MGNIFTKAEGTAEVLNTFFATVFRSSIDDHHESWRPDLGDREGKQHGTAVIRTEEVKDLVRDLDAHKSL